MANNSIKRTRKPKKKVLRFMFFGVLSFSFMVYFFGIVFDIIGTATLTGNEATFHAKSAKKIKGSKEGVYLIKNGSRIASICNDVIGDICGIVSGSLSAMVGLVLSIKLNVSPVITILITSSVISSLTVGGKAMGKKVAVKKSDEIIFMVSKILNKFKRS